MTSSFSSAPVQVTDYFEAVNHAFDHGWTDGLPIVPPAKELVEQFLAYAELTPDHVVGAYKVRNRVITAEKVAINAVMAGCKPEYMPVVLAGVECVTDPDFHLNHIASLSSAWPAWVVNGPITRKLGMNSGMYVLGPGNRANATIPRAISLLLANCMEAKVGGVQRGCMGNPGRLGGMMIAENEDTSWDPMSVMRGYPRGADTITVIPTMDWPQYIIWPKAASAEALAAVLMNHIAESWFITGTHLVVLSPSYQHPFLDAKWSAEDLRQRLLQHTITNVASLKRKGRWEPAEGRMETDLPPIEPGDESKAIHINRFEDFYWRDRPILEDTDFLIAIAGGDVGLFAAHFGPYPVAAKPVTKVIRSPAKAYEKG